MKWFRVFVAQLHNVTVVNTDVEKSLRRSLSSDLDSLISNHYPSVVPPLGIKRIKKESKPEVQKTFICLKKAQLNPVEQQDSVTILLMFSKSLLQRH